MVKRIFLFLTTFFLLTSSALAQDIRVGIVNGQRSAVIETVNGEALLEGAGEIKAFLPGQSYLISVEQGILKINGEKISAKTFVFYPKDENAEIKVNKRSYRGAFSISILSSGNFLNVVNVLPVEEYLYGILVEEVQPLWPEEALKAQVIVNRTMAYRAIRENSQRPYDIAAIGSQSYYGKEAEKEEITVVIDATKGLVATLQGTAIDAQSHASSGGRTEAGARQYLQSVLDFDQDCPEYEWEKIFSAKDIDIVVKYAGHDIGSLRGFDFSPMNIAKLDSLPDRGKSGRLKEIKIIAERGFATIPGEQFARMLGLPSSAFDIAVDNIIPQSVDIPITDRYGNVIGVKKMPVEVRGNVTFPPDRPNVQRVTWAENEKIIIRGRGKGSGLGFSQWGARGLALMGKDYETILAYYFPGTDVRKVY